MNDLKFLKIKNDDLEIIREWRNSSEVSQYMYTDNEISSEQHKNWFKKIETETSSKYWIIEYDNKKIGLVYIYDIDLNNSKCFWGFYLGDTSVRGKGIGGKVEYFLLKYVFEELNLNKICAEVFSFNEKVIEMHQKFGFKQEGYFRQHIYKNDIFMDVVSIALMKSEWTNIKEDLFERVYRTL